MNLPHTGTGDRRKLAYFKAIFIYLIFSGLGVDLWSQNDKVLINNELAFQSLFQQFIQLDQGSYSRIEGYYYLELDKYNQPDTTAEEFLWISDPLVTYEKVAPKKFLRNISAEFIYRDSLADPGREFHMELNDTLNSGQVRLSRKTDRKELRGASPFFLTKFMIPAVGTVAGIAGIISLFYIRS